MENKRLLLQFFHERAYRPQPLAAFEDEARRAAALGAEYVFIGEIPKDHADWDAHPGDPYPNWGMLLTNLFKLVVPAALESALDTESATVGGWTIECFGRFPRVGESFLWRTWTVTVLAMDEDGRRVEKVSICPHGETEE